MATLLDVKRKEAELKRVDAAKFELELKIMERQEEIQRIQDNIAIQDKRIQELNAEITQMKESGLSQ
jgi:peptidoglycan hydrolase CwlO-like protein